MLEDSKDTRIRYNNCNGCSTGITLSNSHDNGIYDNTCSNCGSGIHLSYSNSNTLNHNTCNNCEDGISIQGSESNHLESNNCCENYHGIYLTESRENDILNNICCNNNSSGIYLKNSVDNYIHGNECNNNDYGIYLTESDSNTIFNNECLNNFYCGIYVEWSEWNHIRNNECKNNAITYLRIEERIEAGITLFHSNHSEIENNVCEDNVNHGICLAYSHENEVGLNYCRYNSLYGIYLYYSNGNTLHGNICSHNDQGIVMYESDGNSVYNNRISNNDHGINAGRAFSLNEIYENEIYYNNYAIYLNNSRNDTIRNNIIYENNYGIYLSNSSYNIILNNIFFDNNVNLIEVGECSGNQKPPIITSFIPGRNALIAQNNYYVMANYTDEDGINATAVHLIFDNIDVTNSSDVTTSYIRYDFTVDDGFHSIALYIEDNTGNSIWFNWTFTVDTTPPSVIIISPQNITYTTSYIPINVSVQDLSNVSCVIAEINGITNYTLILFNGYYVNSSLVSLNQGSNIIKIYANDTLNNFNSSQYVVCTIDEVPPQVISIIPANNSYIAQNSYYVIVNYTDASGVNSSAVRIFFDNVNITDYSIITFEYAEYNFTEVSDGPHTVAILLVDNVGNAQWFNWTFYVDTTPPSIVIISPMPNQTVDRGDIEIIASISDSISGLSLPSICIFVDENNVTSFATINQTHVSYTPSIPLQDGIHKVNITVADMLGNTITTSWSFMVDAPLSYAYIYMNQTGGATIFIGTPVAFDIKAYNIHDYGKSGIVFTLYVADVPVYTSPATNESGITSFVYVFNTIPGGTIYAMNGSISTNTTSLIVTLPPLPIPDEIILTANATNIQAGDTVLFVISAKKSGNPLSGTYVDLYVNDMYIKRFGPTDESGNLTYIRLFPAIGSYNFFAKSYDGSIQSSILTINVTAPPPIEITSTLETDMPSNITLDRDLFASSFMLVANTTTNASISIVLTNETIPGVNTFNSFNLSIEKSDPTASVNITINFKVTQEWIITNNIDKFTVTLYHFNGSHWNPLPTNYIGEDETFVYYSALATSLSPFAAGGNSIVDNTPPTFSGWSPTNNTIVTTARPTIVVNYTDNIGINLTTIVFKLDGQDVTVSVVKSLTGVSYTPFADLLQGSHTVYVSVNDTSNNMNFTTWYFTIDSMPPYLISYTPANYSYLSTQIINITLLVNDTISPINTNSIVFKIDGITRDPSLSGSFATGWIINYTINLLDGFHNVTVDISDIQNNTATFVIFFYVDTTPPIISSLYPANNTIIGNNRPTISCNYTDAISGISISSIKLYVDNVNVTEYASIDSTGISYTPIANLSDGLHNVALYVIDVVGNEIWSNWSFSIDTSAPIIYSISPTPGSVVTTLTPIISANYSDPNGIQSVKILINGSDVTSLSTVTTSGITYIPTALMNDSYYTVFLFVNDTLNNCAIIEWTFFVAIPDTVPPTIFSLSPSDGSTITTKMPTISASFSDNVAIDTTSVIIKVDGVDVTANSIITQTGFSYTPPVALSEGSHTVYVFVKDTSNNQATKTWSFTISIPTPPPVLPPTPTPVPSTTTSIIFSIVANTPTLVDIGGQAPESSIRTIELITNESFSSLQIIAEEYSNNPTSIPLPIEITPISFIKIELNVPSNVVTQATIRFRVSKSSLFSLDPSSIQLYRLDTTWTGLPTSLITQDDSYYYFEATLSGFSYFAIGAKSLVPDAIPPTIISFSPEGIIFNQRPVIYIKYYDNVGIALFSIRLLIDGIDVTSLAILNSSMTMYIPIANLSEGAHSIYFEVKDTSGNIATATWSFTIKLPDTTPPIIYSVYPSNGSLIYETALVINAHYSDDVGIDISSIILSIDDSIVIPTKLNSSYVEYAAIFNVGSHTISLTVKDTSGNIATATWSFTIKLPDTTPPKISIISPLNGTILSNKSITINASYSDDVEIDITSITLKLDGRDVTAYSIITPISIIYSTTLEEGSHTISLTVKDTSGNIATATWSFTIAIPIDYTLYIIVILAIVALGSIILILKRVKP
ncbi:MAG: NosD domain-containing protein [Candidatus Methanomethylicaceae archaeon]